MDRSYLSAKIVVVFVAAVCTFSLFSALDPEFNKKLPLLWERFFDIWQYWYGLISALIGARLAISWEKKRQRESQQRALQKLKIILEKDSSLLLQLHCWIAHRRGMPNFGLDTASLSLWIFFSAGIIPETILTRLDAYRFQLDHINTRLLPIYSATIVLECSVSVSEGNSLPLGRSLCQLIDHLEIQFYESEEILRLMGGDRFNKTDPTILSDFERLKLAVRTELKLWPPPLRPGETIIQAAKARSGLEKLALSQWQKDEIQKIYKDAQEENRARQAPERVFAPPDFPGALRKK